MFNLKVVCPTGVSFQGNVKLLEIKTTQGYMGLLQNHSAITANIVSSTCWTIEEDGNKTSYITHNGLLTFRNNICVLITEFFEKSSSFNIEKMKEQSEILRKKLEENQGDQIAEKELEILISKIKAKEQNIR
jgi:F-type H+-transporting ATPase subunit epsilon